MKRERLLKMVSWTYCAITLFVIVTTLIMSGLFLYIWPPEAKLPNWLYYIGAVLLGLFIYKFKDIKITERWYCIIIVLLTFLFAVFQIFVSMWFPEGQHADFWSIYKQSHMLINGDGFSDPELLKYFNRFENINLDKLYLFTLIFKLAGTWRAVILVGALATTLSCLFVGLTIKNVTKSNTLSVIFYVLSFVLIGMNWRAYLPYSDSYVILFPVLCIYFLTKDFSNRNKTILVSTCATIAFFMKGTSFILVISLFIIMLLQREKYYTKDKIVDFVKYSLPIIFILFAARITFINYSSEKYEYRHLEQEERFQGYNKLYLLYSYVCCGQNNAGLGTVGFSDNDGKNGFVHFYERKIWGNIKFFAGKTMVTFRDGTFSSIQAKAVPEELERCHKSGNFQFMLQNTPSYDWFVGIEQIIWNLILLGLLLYGFSNKDFLYYILSLMFIGIYLYLMIFETRAKYLYLFTPLFMTMAAIGIDNLNLKQIFLNIINVLKKRNNFSN